MNVKFSRHAKRRMKLYGISEDIVKNLLEKEDEENRHIIIKDVPEFIYPIKIVFENKMNHILVITVYPLKRGYR